MGKWHMVHLFDERKFNDIVIPKLQGRNGGIKDDFIESLVWFPIRRFIVDLPVSEKDNLIQREIEVHRGFFNLVEMAYQNDLGLIQGVDMNDNLLQKFPRHKLVPKSKWNEENSFGINFEI